MADVRLIYTTWPNAETAGAAAQLLVSERLAACANVVPGGFSFYWWEGEVQGAAEVVVFFKTSRLRVRELWQRVKEIHPFDAPAFVALDIDGSCSSATYVDWIEKETARDVSKRT